GELALRVWSVLFPTGTIEKIEGLHVARIAPDQRRQIGRPLFLLLFGALLRAQGHRKGPDQEDQSGFEDDGSLHAVAPRQCPRRIASGRRADWLSLRHPPRFEFCTTRHIPRLPPAVPRGSRSRPVRNL